MVSPDLKGMLIARKSRRQCGALYFGGELCFVVGDEVTATALAARDGSNSGFLQELKVADGRTFKFTTDANGN
jgi:hypothetical protein